MATLPTGAKSRPGALIFIALFVAFSVFLLTQIGSETKFFPKKGWAVQPRFWPAVGVIMMVGFGLAHLLLSWRARDGWAFFEALTWLRVFEYFGWFMVYVTLVPLLGYLVSTILFTVALSFRQGFRSTRALAAAAILGISIVLIFKTGLSVKIPGGLLYEYLPGALRNFMILNF